MNASLTLALLNPTLSLVFCTTFLVVWNYQRTKPYVGLVALSYLCITLGFVFQYLTLPIGLQLTRMVSNSLFLGAAVAMVTAMSWRYRRPAPMIALVLLASLGIGAVGWFMFVSESLVWRVYIMNFATGSILLIGAAEIRAATNKTNLDRLLMVVFAINGAMLFLRTILTVQLGADLSGAGSLHGSLYWTVFTFTQAIMSLLVVMALFTAVVVDVIGDLKAEIQTDVLSGLLNRRGFEQAVELTMSESRKRPLPISLILADLDHFKSINDTFGHGLGDRVIVSFATVLRTVVGEHHPIGRIGGEEFAVIVRGADVKTARLLAEGVRVAFSSAPTPGRSLAKVRRLTASFGVAEWQPDESYADLLMRADAALYNAKNSGRDQVQLAAQERAERKVATARPL